MFPARLIAGSLRLLVDRDANVGPPLLDRFPAMVATRLKNRRYVECST